MLKGENSLWYFIPCNIFKKCGGLHFLLKCNYSPSKLPLKLSNFHRQALLVWNLLYVHNFSPHKDLLWNNKDITIKNSSFFLPSWHEKGISHIIDLFNSDGNFLSYEEFLSTFHLPVRYVEFSRVCQAIPTGILQLMKYLPYSTKYKTESKLTINGFPLLDKRCDNKLIRNALHAKYKCSPRGKFFWNECINDIDWKKAWLMPYKYCISNKTKELHFKILHKIYPCNEMLAKFMDMDSGCALCDMKESIAHIFYECNAVGDFWLGLSNHLSSLLGASHIFSRKDILFYFTHHITSIEFVTNFFILCGKFFVHKNRFLKAKPNFNVFLIEFTFLLQTLRLVKNKKNDVFLKYYDSIMHTTV